MKLNRGLFLVATLAVASFAVTGCSKSLDGGATTEGVETEQASVGAGQGTEQAVAANEGFTQDACPNAAPVRGAGFRRGERIGFRAGERVGFRRGPGRGLWRARPWWRVW